ncbi:trehalose-phosphatase [Nocardioides acrostichi]|uniref:Trehalose 6-phosphate phosphatase n=1 Tax=Nocardioides acrostichi TaxID=2784339 RepID=A0A930UVB8_9ACTN|nr:trehalose-phosphatase [Nocardioides acrostichi]MBF4161523.1 trehalose-phosphatase [Nocardioides acrostichi]
MPGSLHCTADGERRWTALLDVLDDVVVGLDFDGTLAPIVDDPEQAHIHPEAGAALVALASHVRAIAVITGRPARQVLDLGGLEEIGDAVEAAGSQLYVFGQYGHERWTSSARRIDAPRPPRGLVAFERELPHVLGEAGADDAFVEDKGLAVAVHTRRLADPAGAFRAVLPLLTELAERHDLIVEPGRNVVEVRTGGMDKGQVVQHLVERLSPSGFLFAGDDLGDVQAFEALTALADGGLPVLRVCSASSEESALRQSADLVVPGPAGVVDLLARLAAGAPTTGAPVCA